LISPVWKSEGTKPNDLSDVVPESQPKTGGSVNPKTAINDFVRQQESLKTGAMRS
jgi:hypothetical protein